MRRILHVVGHLKKNGTETFIMNLYRAIDRTRYQFDFLTFSPEKEGFYEEILELGGKVFFTPSRKKGSIDYHKSLDKFFKEHAGEYDTVHYHVSSLTSVAPLFYAKKHGIPQRIIHTHSINCTGIHNKILHRLNRLRISSLATDFLGCSQAACVWGYEGTPAIKHSKVITNGIDLSNFYPDEIIRKRTREELGITDNKVILHIGTFNPIKNHKFLLDTFKALEKDMPDARLVSVGTGDLLDKTKDYAAEIGIKDKVLFLGRRNDVNNLMRAADIFVLPSVYEGLGIVLIEAQASGVKVIASANVPPETKVNKSTIYLPLESGAEKWATEIKEMLTTGSEEIDNSISDHSIQTTVSQIYSVYSAIE